MDVAKVLSKEQTKVLEAARQMVQAIVAGCITPKVVARKMDGTLTSGIVRRSMRILSRHYTELRRQVEKPRVFDPRGQAALTPTGKI